MTFEPTIKAEALAEALRTQRIGRTVLSLAQTASTNDVCWQHLSQRGLAADGTVILTDYQTAGRGRFNRAWLSPRASSVLLSALVVQPPEPLLVERLSLIAGIAACRAGRAASGAEIHLRWPNDLVCRRRKVGGVLVEFRQWQGRQVAAVIGIGINCLQQAGHFPPEIRQKGISLDMLSSDPISRFDVAVELHWAARRMAVEQASGGGRPGPRGVARPGRAAGPAGVPDTRRPAILRHDDRAGPNGRVAGAVWSPGAGGSSIHRRRRWRWRSRFRARVSGTGFRVSGKNHGSGGIGNLTFDTRHPSPDTRLSDLPATRLYPISRQGHATCAGIASAPSACPVKVDCPAADPAGIPSGSTARHGRSIDHQTGRLP